MIIEAKPAGQTSPKVEKFAIESILYTINCSALLEHNEVITGVSIPSISSNISFSDIRSRKGTTIEVKISNTPIGSPFIDFNVKVLFTTNLGSSKVAIFLLKVHK